MSMARVKLFPGIIFAFIGLNMAICAVTVYLATSDRSFAVEPAYYQKALAWNETSRERIAGESLGLRIEVSAAEAAAAGAYEVVVHVIGPDGEPVKGARVSATAFANVRAQDRLVLSFAERGEGVYAAGLRSATTGLWEVRVRVEHAGAAAVTERSIELGTGRAKGGREP